MDDEKHAAEDAVTGCKRHLHEEPKKSLKCTLLWLYLIKFWRVT